MPATPNRRRIARSCPIVVLAAAAAPQAVASATARSRRVSRSSVSPVSCMTAVWRGYPESIASVRAGWPIQTWPSVNRSAFQIGARALVSSIA